MPRLPGEASIQTTAPRQNRARVGLQGAEIVEGAVSPRVGRDPGVGNVSRVVQPVMDLGLEQAGEALQRMAAARERIEERRRAVARDRADITYTEEMRQKFRELEEGGDLADPALTDEFGQFSQQRLDELVQASNGDPALQLRLIQTRNQFADKLGQLSAEAQRKQLDDSLDRRVNAIVAEAVENPNVDLGTVQEQIETELDFLGISNPIERRERLSEGLSVAVSSKIATLIDGGEISAAEAALEDPATAQLLSPTKRVELNGRILSAQQAVRNAPQTRILTPEEVSANFPAVPQGSIVEAKIGPSGEISGIIMRFTPPQDNSVRQQKIAEFTAQLEAMGVDGAREKATGLVDGTIDVEVSQDTREALLVDKAKAIAGRPDAATVLPIQSPSPEERAEIPQGTTLWDMSEHATGLLSAARSVIGRVPGTDVSAEEEAVIDARSTFATFSNDLARALVLNERFPVAERRAVLDALDLAPAIWDTPPALRVRLKAADRNLRTRLAQFERDARDQSLPPDVRATQNTNASAMRNAIDRLGVPQADVPLTVEAIAGMPPESLKFVLRDLTPQEWEELDEDVKRAVTAVLRGEQEVE